MISSRIKPIVDPQLLREQAGFQRGRSTVNQVDLLTQEIEDSFQANEKVGVVLLDLMGAYDTISCWAFVGASIQCFLNMRLTGTRLKKALKDLFE